MQNFPRVKWQTRQNCFREFVSYLVPEFEARLDVGALGEALVLLHVVGEGVVAVGHLLLRQEDWIVETHEAVARQALQPEVQMHLKKYIIDDFIALNLVFSRTIFSKFIL